MAGRKRKLPRDYVVPLMIKEDDIDELNESREHQVNDGHDARGGALRSRDLSVTTHHQPDAPGEHGAIFQYPNQGVPHPYHNPDPDLGALDDDQHNFHNFGVDVHLFGMFTKCSFLKNQLTTDVVLSILET